MDVALNILRDFGGWTVAVVIAVINWWPKKGSLENVHIDQLQEMIDRLEKRLDLAEATISKLRKIRRTLEDYIGVLRRCIEDRKEPPPPSWPEMDG